MRHLSRKYAPRKSLLRNLATSLILYERIKTTTAKAKELKPIVERLISKAKNNDLTARRQMLAFLFDENAVKKMFEVLVPRFKNIKSGFIKSYHIGQRLGDGADMMILELGEGEKTVEKIQPVKSGKTGSQSEITQGKGEEIKIENPSTKLGVKEKDAKDEKTTGAKPTGRKVTTKKTAK